MFKPLWKTVLLSGIEIPLKEKIETDFNFCTVSNPKSLRNFYKVEDFSPDCELYDLRVGDNVVVMTNMVETLKYADKTVIICPERAIIGIEKEEDDN